MIGRRGFLARLFVAPIVALALLKAPVAETDPDVTGTLISQFDADASDVTRLDLIYGFKPIGPQLAVRIQA